MWYVGIDQHKRHLTVCIIDSQGQITQRRQVSTGWLEVRQFLSQLAMESKVAGGYIAVMEICGFNGWLVRELRQHGCAQALLITAPRPSRQKTDRRDAKVLAELLWVNRERIAAGQKLLHVSVVYQPHEQEQADRTLTQLRHERGRRLTQTKNAIAAILRRHNLEQECPTKSLFTQAGVKWLRTLKLPQIDAMALEFELELYERLAAQLHLLDNAIVMRAKQHPQVPLLRTLPKIGAYTALALLAHIGPIGRFRSAKALANFFGLTPGSHDSGERRRPGGITKTGHPFVRFLLAQTIVHTLRNDAGLREWYRDIKRRRGSKIARVAVMRRLCEALWHMLSRNEPYRSMGPGPAVAAAAASPRAKSGASKTVEHALADAAGCVRGSAGRRDAALHATAITG
jgi:transposase